MLHGCLNSLKNSEGDARTLKMIQELGGHQQFKIWKLLQKFMKWCQDTVDLETGGGGSALCGDSSSNSSLRFGKEEDMCKVYSTVSQVSKGSRVITCEDLFSQLHFSWRWVLRISVWSWNKTWERRVENKIVPCKIWGSQQCWAYELERGHNPLFLCWLCAQLSNKHSDYLKFVWSFYSLSLWIIHFFLIFCKCAIKENFFPF